MCSVEFAKLGLQINASKSATVSHHPEEIIPNVPFASGAKVLGAWVARCDDEEEDWVTRRVERCQLFFQRVVQVDPHCAMHILRICGRPRWQHIVRTHAPHVTKVGCKQFDKLLCGAAFKIADLPKVCPIAEKQISLPIALGGLGLATYLGQAAAEYESSLQLAGLRVEAPTKGPAPQTVFETLCKENAKTGIRLKHSAWRAPEKVAASTPSPQSWLEIPPNRDFAMAPHEFRAALRQYLDLSPQEGTLFFCNCGKSVPAKEAAGHQQICRSKHGYTVAHRHDNVRDTFRAVCKEYGIATTPEPRGFVPDTTQGPDVIAYTAREQYVIDFCVKYPLGHNNMQDEVKEVGASLLRASEGKHAHYAGACKEHQRFVTLGMSSFGLFSQEALNCISAISRHTAKPRVFYRHMTSALPCSVSNSHEDHPVGHSCTIRCV
jgi:hypothetical protein